MRRIYMVGTSPQTMGGISAVVNVYAEAQLLNRFDVVYITSHIDGGAMSKAITALKGLAAYLIALLSGRVGLLHVHVSSRASFWRKSLFILPTLLTRVPVAFHLHSGGFDRFYESECGSLKKAAVRFVMRKSSVVIALSESWREWIVSTITSCKVRVIVNPVIVPEETIVRPPTERPQILALGRLGKEKGTYDLLKAMPTVLAQVPGARLMLGGDGDHDGVERLARELGISDSVSILGWVRGQAKAALLHEAAVYALPSYAEGMPMGLLEAMSYGLPVVSTRVGGIPEVVDHDRTGVLIEAGEVDRLAKAIVGLLTDQTRREEMGSQARESILRRFSAKVVVQQIEQLYQSFGFNPGVKESI